MTGLEMFKMDIPTMRSNGTTDIWGLIKRNIENRLADERKQKPLAVLADKHKHVCVTFVDKTAKWNIYLLHTTRKLKKINAETYAEAEAKAREYLEGL